jgi:hypothetical protein
MPTTTNYGWTTPADTDLVKDGASAIRTLGTAIDTTVFNNASAAIAKTIVDAKGDIIAATAADTVARLAVGANDTVLTADSSTATGLKWAAPAAGGMTLISTTTLSGTSVTLSSIPQTYNSLFLIIRGMTYASGDNGFRLFPNNVNNLADTSRVMNGTAGSANDTWVQLSAAENILRTNADNVFALQFDNYTSTTTYKPFTLVGTFSNVTPIRRTYFAGGAFKSNSAISSIVIDVEGTVSFSTGTVLLYGVK